jgi:hypothetical protein
MEKNGKWEMANDLSMKCRLIHFDVTLSTHNNYNYIRIISDDISSEMSLYTVLWHRPLDKLLDKIRGYLNRHKNYLQEYRNNLIYDFSSPCARLQFMISARFNHVPYRCTK